MPFGRPVVPDEYSIAAPNCSSAIGSVGWPLMAVSQSSKGPSGAVPASSINHRSTFGQSAGSCDATSALAVVVMTTRLTASR